MDDRCDSLKVTTVFTTPHDMSEILSVKHPGQDRGRDAAHSVGNLGDLHGISSEFPNDPCTSDC